MIKPPRTLLVISVLLTPLSLPKADENWHRVRQNDGIEVHVQQVSDSDIIRAKVRASIAAPLKRVQAILDDVAHRPEWVPFLQTSRIVHRSGPGESLEYSLFAAPWPASDRDFVYRMVKTHEDNTRMEYHMKSVISESIPEQPGIVRANLIESHYSLIALDAQHTAVELVFHADPGGWIPNWLINIIQKILPYRIIRNLRTRAMLSVAEQSE